MVNPRHSLLAGAIFAILAAACTDATELTSTPVPPKDAGGLADAGAALRFKVGGTVKGLSGKGLILQNNGGDDLTIAEDGSFTFPTTLPSGAPYAVTVKEGPSSPTQKCTVSGGSGTVMAGNVSSIVVNCDTSSFTIGGTISGLAGIGLVVQSSGENLAINSNGTFAFPTPVKSGQLYDVTVKTQPGLPSQTCTVTGGKGTVAAANVSDIAIECTTNKYSIGGTVHGLIGTGFTLKNGDEELNVAEDGTFTFPTTIESGQPYDVTVKRNPFAPSQKCVISGGSGVVGSGNVTSIVANCETNTYTVGGTIIGLVGTGLVLQNSGGDNLPITSNGTFAFSTPVKSGKPYAVTVATQPGSPSQTCAITDANGTVEGANVTDVAIVCTINEYAIGGTVSGLTGTGLVLQNGTEELPVAADGTFTFPTTIASGQPYAVSVKKNPLSPAQTCTVTGASGLVVAGNVSSVAVNCSTNSYTVGGTITGLAGSGLVLQNGTEELPVAADGSFAFPTPVKSGQPYTVSVKTEPGSPSQTCTVTSPSGVVAAANVTAVSIACTTNKYTIGGTVSGLAGSGLVLKNGAEEIPVSANGSFTFPTSIASGQPYAVTVKRDPSTPAQTCNVSGASGTVVAGNVTSVVVNCSTNTYTVGGSIAGLASSGLVLQNGTEELPVSIDGLFAFAGPVESGKPYNVSVKTQPASPSQTCTVTAPSGTVAAANVTDVAIACTTNTYSVGGNVSGLSGSGLVLQNNLGDDLPVAADGTFTFPTAIASGAGFAVAVKTQPTTPSQSCSVTGGSGLVTSSAISSVAVTCTTSTFSIGGSVSGLVGSGLVLSNGAEELPVALDGSFTFPTRVVSGGSYAITVKTQPTSPWQTCAVTSGAGPVTSSNITSASVVCATDAFTVSAAVSGFPGGTLVLQNNAGDDLSVTASGTSTFSLPVASGASYAVTIKTVPAGANCEVASGGTGTITNAGVTANVSCSPCGAEHQACCISGSACGSGLACSSGLVCENATPVCSTTPGIGFFSPVNYAVGGRLQSVDVGDFNLDGKEDLVTANAVTTVVSVLLGKGDGTFQPSVDVPAGNNPGDSAIGDFNGDGKPDIAVANAGGNNVSVLLNTCAVAPCATPSFAAPVNYATGNRPRRITVGDVNRDSVLDILTANENSNSISVLLGNGNGTFQAKVDLNPIGTQPYDVQLADFNGDNKLDIVAVNFGMGDTAAVFINTCNAMPCATPSFAAAVTYAVGESPMGVTVADFNGDGRKDIATANYFSSDVSILLGNGNGTFQNAVNYPSAALPSHITATDLDADGYLDLVTSVDIGSLISVFRGRGDGTFYSKVDFNVGQSGASDVSKATAAADFDGDGDIDLAVAVDMYNHVSMMMNGRVSCVVP